MNGRRRMATGGWGWEGRLVRWQRCSDLICWDELRAHCEDHPLQQNRAERSETERGGKREAGETSIYCCWFQRLGRSKNLGLESGSPPVLQCLFTRWRVMETIAGQIEKGTRARGHLFKLNFLPSHSATMLFSPSFLFLSAIKKLLIWWYIKTLPSTVTLTP